MRREPTAKKVIAWLRTPEGERWSHERTPLASACRHESGIFGSIKEDAEGESDETAAE